MSWSTMYVKSCHMSHYFYQNNSKMYQWIRFITTPMVALGNFCPLQAVVVDPKPIGPPILWETLSNNYIPQQSVCGHNVAKRRRLFELKAARYTAWQWLKKWNTIEMEVDEVLTMMEGGLRCDDGMIFVLGNHIFVEQVQNLWHHLMCETDILTKIHHDFAAPKSWNIDLGLSGQWALPKNKLFGKTRVPFIDRPILGQAILISRPNSKLLRPRSPRKNIILDWLPHLTMYMIVVIKKT